MKFITFISTLVISVAVVCGLPAQAQSVSGQGTWETTLLGRDIDRQVVAATSNDAVYLFDTSLNVTWLRDANANGLMDWSTATSWAANLVTGSVGAGTAVSDWRLPAVAANQNWTYSFDGSTAGGYNVPGNSSEMASLFFNTLGNKSYYNTSGNPQTGFGLTNEGSFQNMQSDGYWLGTEFAPYAGNAWLFDISNGGQSAGYESNQLYALAVRPGDVLAPVPEPETYLMLLLGLTVLGMFGRRRSRVLGSLARR